MITQNKTVSIVGVGKLGLCFALTLEQAGYDVVGVDVRQAYVDMLKAGIIDPKKVTRIALENAASVAGMILTTECALIDIKEDNAGGGMPPMGGGMPGMM